MNDPILEWLRGCEDPDATLSDILALRRSELDAEQEKIDQLARDVLLLKQRGISGAALAYAAGVSPGTFSLLVRGKKKYPKAFDAVVRVVAESMESIK